MKALASQAACDLRLCLRLFFFFFFLSSASLSGFRLECTSNSLGDTCLWQAGSPQAIKYLIHLPIFLSIKLPFYVYLPTDVSICNFCMCICIYIYVYIYCINYINYIYICVYMLVNTFDKKNKQYCTGLIHLWPTHSHIYMSNIMRITCIICICASV